MIFPTQTKAQEYLSNTSTKSNTSIDLVIKYSEIPDYAPGSIGDDTNEIYNQLPQLGEQSHYYDWIALIIFLTILVCIYRRRNNYN